MKKILIIIGSILFLPFLLAIKPDTKVPSYWLRVPAMYLVCVMLTITCIFKPSEGFKLIKSIFIEEEN